MLLPQNFLLQDRYRIEALLGRGGMGAVYRATDTRLGHAVAIKQNLFETADGTSPLHNPTRPEDTEARRGQFEREARLLASLKHAGLPKVTDYFWIPGEGQYLVMDFIEGQDFGAVVQQLGALREEHAAGFILEVAQVLDYLHGQNPPIIHRDIKPANIRVTPRGQVYLVDFGVAKIGTSQKTMFGAQAVTPGFSPLEQFGGDKPTDQRADVYSLAATLYTLTTGTQPPSAIEVLRGRKLFDETSSAVMGLKPELREVIAKGMAQEPEDRYQTMREFHDALQQVFPERNQRLQSQDTVHLVTQIYTQPMGSPGGEMGVVGPTARPRTGAPGSGWPPSGGGGFPTAPGIPTAAGGYPPSTGRPASGPPPRPEKRKSAVSPAFLALLVAIVAIIALAMGHDLVEKALSLRGGNGEGNPGQVEDGESSADEPANATNDGNASKGGGSAHGTRSELQAPDEQPAHGVGSKAWSDSLQRTVEGAMRVAREAEKLGQDMGRKGNQNWNPMEGSSGKPSSPPPPIPPTAPAATPGNVPPPPTPPSGALPNELIVSTSEAGAYRTLDAALTAHYNSGASVARTITVRPGRYSLPADLVLHTPIKIVGQGDVTLDGSGQAALRIRGSGITLRGLTIRSTGQYGVLVVGNGSVSIENCTVTSSREASLAATESASINAQNTEFTGANFGVIADGSSHIGLNGCTLVQNQTGAQARAQGSITMTGGSISRNKASGLLVSAGGAIDATGTAITNNGGNGATARQGRITLTGTQILKNAGYGTACDSGGQITRTGGEIGGNLMGDTQGCP